MLKFSSYYEVDTRLTEIYHEQVALIAMALAEDLVEPYERFECGGEIHVIQYEDEMSVIDKIRYVDDGFMLPSGNYACLWYANNNSGGPSFYIPKEFINDHVRKLIKAADSEDKVDSQITRLKQILKGN